VEVLRVAYPEERWLPWRFDPVPPNYWNDRSNQLAYVEWLGNILGFAKREDWYSILLPLSP